MKTTKKKLTAMIQEAINKALKEFHKHEQTFIYKGLELGPVTVKFIYHPVRSKTLYQPEEGGNTEITGLLFNGKPVDPEALAHAENDIIVPTGEPPLTGDELLDRIQLEVENERSIDRF